MLTFIAFMMAMVVYPFAAAGTAKLLYTITQPGELFGGWQKVLIAIHPKSTIKHRFIREFFYKRLGGCITCFRQTIAELTFAAFVVMWNCFDQLPTGYIDNDLLRWVLNFTLYVAFCSIALTIGQWLEYQKDVAEAAEEITEAKIK